MVDETELWLERCAAQFEKRVPMSHLYAMECAQACLENGGLDDDPEDAADEEMSCWTDDEEAP